MNIKLKKFYPPGAFQKEFAEVVYWGHFHTFDIPREVVVKSLQIVMPCQGRIYSTSLYAKGGKYLTYEELYKTDMFRGIYSEYCLYVVELWQDRGDDGHTNFSLEGYAFVAHRGDLKELIDGALELGNEIHDEEIL